MLTAALQQLSLDNSSLSIVSVVTGDDTILKKWACEQNVSGDHETQWRQMIHCAVTNPDSSAMKMLEEVTLPASRVSWSPMG